MLEIKSLAGQVDYQLQAGQSSGLRSQVCLTFFVNYTQYSRQKNWTGTTASPGTTCALGYNLGALTRWWLNN
jgi:hypothetical protein